jgi:hypothetical protein
MFKEDILEYFKSSNIYDNKKFNLFLTILNEDITSEDIKRNKYK